MSRMHAIVRAAAHPVPPAIGQYVSHRSRCAAARSDVTRAAPARFRIV